MRHKIDIAIMLIIVALFDCLSIPPGHGQEKEAVAITCRAPGAILPWH